MSVKEHARRLSAKMKHAMKKSEKDLGERHPDHKIFDIKFSSTKTLLLWFLILVIIFAFLVSFTDMSFRNEGSRGGTHYTWYHILTIAWMGLLAWTLPGKDEYYPVGYFAKSSTIGVCLLELTTAVSFSYLAIFHIEELTPILPYCAVTTALTTILLAYLGSHHRLFTYDPFKSNKNYKLTRRVDKSAGYLEIISSRPFQIVLKNVGIESWKSQTGYVIKRQVTINRKRTQTIIPIPKDLFVQSNQKLTLIPETEPPQAAAVRIPHFRCFGYDVGNTVLTTVGHRNPNIKKKLASLEEQFQDLTAPTEWTRIVEMVNSSSGPETIDIL